MAAIKAFLLPNQLLEATTRGDTARSVYREREGDELTKQLLSTTRKKVVKSKLQINTQFGSV